MYIWRVYLQKQLMSILKINKATSFIDIYLFIVYFYRDSAQFN